MDTHDRVSEMRLNLQNIPLLDKIHFHKQTGEVHNTDLLKATLKFSQLQYTMPRFENQLKQENFENKTYQQQIKKVQVDLLVMDSEPDMGQAIKKILVEKENTIQLLKKKLKIPVTQLIHASELTKFEKELELLSEELKTANLSY